MGLFSYFRSLVYRLFGATEDESSNNNSNVDIAKKNVLEDTSNVAQLNTVKKNPWNIRHEDFQISQAHSDPWVGLSTPSPRPYQSPYKERFKTLYRLLRFGERIEDGLSAKNIHSSIDVVRHVAYGSRGNSSKYISTCADIGSATNLRSISYFKGMIVSISVERLPDNVEIIPLITHEDRQKHINHMRHDTGDINRYAGFASRFQEVLLIGYVPSYCLTVMVNGS